MAFILGFLFSSSAYSATPAVIPELELSGSCSVWVKDWFCDSNQSGRELLLVRMFISLTHFSKLPHLKWHYSSSIGRSFGSCITPSQTALISGVGGGMCRNHAMTMLEIESYFLPAFHLKMRKKQEVMPLACDKENWVWVHSQIIIKVRSK